MNLLKTYRPEYNRDEAIDWKDFNRNYIKGFNKADIKKVVSLAYVFLSLSAMRC